MDTEKSRWPTSSRAMPFAYARQMTMCEEELGVKVNWVSFESGVKMSDAMVSGDVQLSIY